ncbi:Rdx family-domain-containing protein [Aspergillus pseudoustus]|uniref:Rdx family-domain-containing protein n=1 Tax=Aspergillus pseudoustus TaxID=1810923 RepID=A0ABR4J3F5_9EURO
MTEPIAPIESHPPSTTSASQSISAQPATALEGERNLTPEEPVSGPRITIQYCTQCKWMLRAAYFAQELLSTFSTDIGEISLVPRTGGLFRVTIFPSTTTSTSSKEGAGDGTVLWDRKRDGGFPEVKVLKSLVRNVIDPSRDLGHTDRALKKGSTPAAPTALAPAPGVAATAPTPSAQTATSADKACEDCQ